MIDYPKFIEMQKMFHGKSMTVVEVQHVAETQTVTIDVNVVDVNVTIRSKAIEKQVFKDRKPRKAKSVVDLEKEEQLKKSMVETIQHICVDLDKRAIHIHGRMEHNMVRYAKYYSCGST
jgi:hypothetical protein